MNAADLWSRVWMLVDANPWLVAIALVLLLCLLGTLVATALLSLSGPESDYRRRQDDDEQHQAVTRPSALDSGNVIPWTRRVAPPPRQP